MSNLLSAPRPHLPGPGRPPAVAALAVILFFSGACALLYELVWTRLLTLSLGSTALAVSAVLASFMGGLAIGSFWAGRFLDRRPAAALPLYAGLEALIGIFALASPLLLAALQQGYVALSHHWGGQYAIMTAVRFVLSAGLLAFPTACMGATLPAVLTYVLPELRRVGLKVGVLYGLNTLGGVLGAFATGFVLIPLLGVGLTLNAAAALNLALAGAVVLGRRFAWFTRRPETVSSARPAGPDQEPGHGAARAPRADGGLVLLGAGLVGFCSLAFEVLWLRVLHLTFGSSVYAMATLLTAFLAGLGLGSLLIARILDRRGASLGLLGWIEVGVAVSALALVPVLGKFPLLFAPLYRYFYQGFLSFQFVIFAVSFLVLLLPSTLMGAAFPVLCQLHIQRTGSAGRGVGTVYALNTLGAILGSLGATLVLIPLLGSRTSLLAVSALNLGLGAWALAQGEAARSWKRWLPAAAGALVLLAVAGFAPWNPLELTAGVYTTNFVHALQQRKVREVLAGSELVFFREGISSTISVRKDRYSDTLALQVNGKTDASNAADKTTQYLVGYLPFFWQSAVERVCVIGLGSGMTLAAALEGGPGEVDCVELEAGVVQASAWFRKYNRDCLRDPRVHLIRGDGRNYLLAASRPYDVIISEPSNPWITGIANLFTLDHYRLIRQRLRPGGMIVQWFHIYTMSLQDVRIALRTFCEVFPEAHLWWIPQTGDVILLARKDRPLRYDYRIFRDLLAHHPQVKMDLAQFGIRTTGDIFSCFALGPARLREFCRGAPLNTDDRPRIEFSAPKHLYEREDKLMNTQEFMRHLESIFAWLDDFQVSRPHRYQIYTELADAYATQESYTALAELAARITREYPGEAAGFYYQGLCEAQAGHLLTAEGDLDRALRMKRAGRQSHYRLGPLDPERGENRRYQVYLEKKIRAESSTWKSHYQLALTYARERRYRRALRELDAAEALGGRTREMYYYRGLIRYFLQDWPAAERDLSRAAELDPADQDVRLLLHEIRGAGTRAVPKPAATAEARESSP